ncbi:hypothetical protein ACCO45_010080 [Purpureocillium lilacinum]|uniref:Uncharacterized protein n=1 Tax=Purpureocillium lilacinum TaxID=33203 RepID=A0ACC4DDT7_PURLI
MRRTAQSIFLPIAKSSLHSNAPSAQSLSTMPRFMFLIKADPMAESTETDIPTEVFATMAKFNEDMAEAGFSCSPMDSGPFDVSKENHVCGFWVVQTTDAEEALAWAKRVPFPEGEIVVRRIGDSTDFGKSFTKDLLEREEKLRGMLVNNRKAAGV